MPYDPYSPIREELARTGGILERGLARRASRKDKAQEAMLAHEARMTGLDIEKSRLGLAREQFGEQKLTGKAQRGLISEQAGMAKVKREGLEKQEDWLDSTVDPDVFNNVFGEELTSAFINKVKKRATLNDNDTISIGMTNRELTNVLGLLREYKGDIKEFQPDEKGNLYALTKTGKAFPVGIKVKQSVKADKLPKDVELKLKQLLERQTKVNAMIKDGMWVEMDKEFIPLTPEQKAEREKELFEITNEIRRLRGQSPIKRKITIKPKEKKGWKDWYITGKEKRKVWGKPGVAPSE